MRKRKGSTASPQAYGFLTAGHQYVSRKDEGDKMIVVERGDLVFVFNFHPTNSFTDYRIGCYKEGTYKVILSSDEAVFGGYQNVTKNSDVSFNSQKHGHDGRPLSFQVYAPSRTCVVYGLADTADKDADSKSYGIPGLGVKERGPYFSR
ncbi:hypothetical protein CEUSTIGMA_g10065.t1 [Chlamydomonas eustigma]|uniref:Alpha-amylase/branching enzyme C-terminal all beta domain-containing protein n=1 Tax=Chlamydomonas eustigma TaxID=1157962 RepID=A0A250XI96_9CHLO|nr:hypothetical protein CEUSTIGMA_g10065.t1 [Chlamydomonas eustigma]|eukprot:GAX82639.1 hypothetical protein CEUSTIGMA_g10065.t1 [Chlamydomonas eustigma]